MFYYCAENNQIFSAVWLQTTSLLKFLATFGHLTPRAMAHPVPSDKLVANFIAIA